VTEEWVLQWIKDSVSENKTRDLDIIVQVIIMNEDSKQLLRTKGYGWTGLDLYGTCELVPNVKKDG